MRREPPVLLDEDSFDAGVTGVSNGVLVEFRAVWCGPCRQLEAVLERLAAIYAGRCSIAMVDVDRSGDLVHRFGIRSVPTLVLFREGRMVDRMIGAAPEREIRAMLDRHFGP